MNTDTQVIILAGGQGKRMGGDLPKALTKLSGRPMIEYVIDTVGEFTQNKPVTVIGYKGDLIKETLGEKSLYSLQKEQKGTGHAVIAAKEQIIESGSDTIIVLYADQPYVSSDTLKKLSEVKHNKKAKIVIATSIIDDNNLFENQFYNFGRIIRDIDGVITRIVEKKDATTEEVLIREVNPAYFCLDKDWMLECLDNINNNNAQEEYYLTDLVQMAFDQGLNIESVQIEPREALGANTPEQLSVLELFNKK